MATWDQSKGWLTSGREILAAQPFSVLLGAHLAALEAGICQLEVPMNPQLQQNHGFVHGGVVSYLADNALTFAGATAMNASAVTSEFKINYVRPAIGERFVARAQAVQADRAQAVCRCDVFAVKDGVEKLCAVAQGTIARIAVEGSTP